MDGQFYAINIVTGDTVAEIKVKITDAINAVLGSTMTAVATVGESTLTSKWTGLTADSITVEVDTNDVELGISYVTVSTQADQVHQVYRVRWTSSDRNGLQLS